MQGTRSKSRDYRRAHGTGAHWRPIRAPVPLHCVGVRVHHRHPQPQGKLVGLRQATAVAVQVGKLGACIAWWTSTCAPRQAHACAGLPGPPASCGMHCGWTMKHGIGFGRRPLPQCHGAPAQRMPGDNPSPTSRSGNQRAAHGTAVFHGRAKSPSCGQVRLAYRGRVSDASDR